MQLISQILAADKAAFNTQMSTISTELTQLCTDEQGQTIVEYVLVMLFIAAALTGALGLLVPPLEALYNSAIGIF